MQISDGPAINATGFRLGFVDDLHGRDFRCAGNGSAGVNRFKNVVKSHVVSKFRRDFGCHLEQSFMRFNFEHFVCADRSWFRNPSQVIPQQIDNHDVFGAVFKVIKEKFLQLGIFFGIIPSFDRPLHWFCPDFVTAQNKEQLG